MPEASSLKAAIADEFGIEAELIRGSGGVFDVVLDGDLIFSKKQVGRFPENSEIVRTMQVRSA